MDQPGTSSGEHGVSFIKSNKGRRKLLRHGYSYVLLRENNCRSVWRCSLRSCSATITIVESQHIISILNEKAHKCQPNHAKIEIMKMKNLCKEAAANTVTPISQLYEETFQAANDAGYGLLNAIPKFNNISRSLYNVRNRQLNVTKTHFTRPEDVIIPERYKESFLLFDDESDPTTRIIAFCTNKAREIIPSIHTFFLDGTFSSCCVPFYQLYSIHGDINSDDSFSQIVPLIFVLMPNKQQRSYERLFQLLLENLRDWKPREMVVDFEVAAINVIKKEFPRVKIQGCNFHYKQALAKKAHALQFKDIEEKKHLALCASLAHLKQQDIDDAWLYIMEEAPKTEAVTKFNDYFVAQWLENPNIGFMWNVHGARHRTNNLVEAWHKRLNTKIGKRKPRLLPFLDILKKEAEFMDWKIENYKMGIPLKMRTQRSIAFDRELKHILDDYENTSLPQILKKFSFMQRFREL